MARSIQCSIPARVIEEWKNDPENIRDQAAVKVGRYMREFGVSREKAIAKLKLQGILLN